VCKTKRVGLPCPSFPTPCWHIDEKTCLPIGVNISKLSQLKGSKGGHMQPLGEEAFALISDAPRKGGPRATHTYHLQPKRAKIQQKLGS
jgi:hypothetical protein